MEVTLRLLVLVLFVLSTVSCGPKASNVDNDGCYEIDGDSVIYTCNNDSPENPRANTGYDGPYNPKALNLYRPGRFENLNSPVW